MEKSGLRENAVHGTQGYPYAPYSWEGMGGFTVPLHWHSEAEIIYVKEGPCQVTVNKTKYAGEGRGFVRKFSPFCFCNQPE